MKQACGDTRAELTGFLDGELDPARTRQIEEHLEACGPCRAERRALAAVWGALDALPGLEPRPGFVQELEESIVGARVIRFPRWAPVAVAAAAVLLLVGLAWLLGSAEPAPQGGIALDGPPPIVTPDAPQGPVVEAPPEAIPAPVEEKTPAEPALAKAPELEGLSEEELALLDELETVVLLEELDEELILDTLDLLEELGEEELEVDET